MQTYAGKFETMHFRNKSAVTILCLVFQLELVNLIL